MDTPQPSFFDDDTTERPAERTLVLHAQPGRPLSKPQHTFNRLVATVEQLRAKLDRNTRQLDQALVFHAQHVRPRVHRLTATRKDVVRALRPFLADPRLKRSDQQVLRTIMAKQLDEILGDDSSVDDDLRALFEQLHGADLAQIEQEEMEEARSSMAAMFADLGLDVDLSSLHPGMSAEEVAARAAEMADQIRRQAEQARSGDQPGHRKTKRELREEERVRQMEEVRRRSVGTIYRQLAKVLHPDLEQDADSQQRKNTLMQELTAAYANNDLHTLLRLELEWIHREESDVARLTDEKLGAYNQLLKEQVAQLEAALLELPRHPRYQPLAVPEGPFGIRLQIDGPPEVRRLDSIIASLGDTLARLQTGSAWQEVRGMIGAHRTASRVRYGLAAGVGPARGWRGAGTEEF